MIRLLQPKLPTTDSLIPRLRKIEEARWASNWGQFVIELEDRLSAHYDGAYVVTTSSCTAALEIMLRHQKNIGFEFVGFPALTFPATYLAAHNVGLTVLIDDVDAETWCGSYVSLWGVPTTGEFIDAAGAFGEQTVPVGTTAAFSLHATKMVGSGEGGYIVTHDRYAAKEYRAMTNFGLHDGMSVGHGTNAKMSEYAAVVALGSLDAYDREAWLRLHDWYAKYLPPAVVQQKRPRGAYPILSVKLPCAAEPVLKAMRAAGIECRRWYTPVLCEHPLFRQPDWRKRLPVTAGLADHLLGLPYHLWLTEEDVIAVCTNLQGAIANR